MGRSRVERHLLSSQSEREGEAPRAYARGGGDASPGNRAEIGCGEDTSPHAPGKVREMGRSRVERHLLSSQSEREGEAPRAYARGGGDASPGNRAEIGCGEDTSPHAPGKVREMGRSRVERHLLSSQSEREGGRVPACGWRHYGGGGDASPGGVQAFFSKHGLREGVAPAASPVEGATQAPVESKRSLASTACERGWLRRLRRWRGRRKPR